MHRIAILAGSLFLTLSLAATVRAENLTDSVSFDIAAQPIETALLEFSKQTGLQLVVPTGSLPAHTTRAVSGNMPLQAALDLLLSDTNLSYKLVGNRTLTIVPPRNPVSTTESGGAGMYSVADQGRWLRLAQSQSQSSAQQTNQEAAKPEAEEPGKLANQEVIVTARKREERLEDVPASIAVLTSEDISRRGLLNAEDYLRGIPGVTQGRDHAGQSIIIRGIESSVGYQNWYSGTTVATYFGETPTTSSAGLSGGTSLDLKLIDIERVEVLRGPQGTAFGSSSMGGAVRTIPVAPKLDRSEAKVGALYSYTGGYGSGNYMLQATGNLPVVKDRFALRGSIYQYEDSGYYRNRTADNAAFISAFVVPFSSQQYVGNKDDVGAYEVSGGRISGLFEATENLKFSFMYLKQKTEQNGVAIATSGTFTQTLLAVADENVDRGQRFGYTDTDIDIANVVMEYDMGWGNLLATYSFLKGGSGSANTYTAYYPLYQWPLSQSVVSEQKDHVGEIRLVSAFKGPVNFLAGIYGEKSDDTYVDLYYWTAAPETNFFYPAGGHYAGGILDDHRKLKQMAAFTEISWEFAPGFTLTGGARYYDYQRDSLYVTDGLYGDQVTPREADANGTSYRGNLSYKISETAMVYGGWAQGFRLGKPQAGLPTALCDLDNNGIVDGTTDITIASTRSVNSDELDSYEVGGKFSFLDRRLAVEASIFRMNWTGMPVAVGAPPPPDGCALGYTTNAGAAKSEGVELQTNFYATEKLRFDVGASWIRAELTEDVPSAGFKTGTRLPGSPKMNANLGIQQDFELMGRPSMIRADAVYVGDLYGGIETQTPLQRAGDYVKLDASARMTIDKLSLDVFIRNITDEDAFTMRSSADVTEFYGFRLRPRTFGVQLTYDF